MPKIYLSPSTQEYNEYVNGGTEEQYMNLIADAMEPYLRANGIMYTRNSPQQTAAGAIAASNAGTYDLHVGIHSNASPAAQYGQNRGSIAFHYPNSTRGEATAGAIAKHIREIYPEPGLVSVQDSTSIGEVAKVRAVAAFLEIAYHDNEADATWIKNNIEPIGQAIVHGITDYFGLPFLPLSTPRSGIVDTDGGALNIRSLPSMSGTILAHAYDGAPLTILNEWMGWYVIEFGMFRGFASKQFITLI